MSYLGPRRTVSVARSITVNDPSVLPAWYPDAGTFNTIYRADQPGSWHNPNAVDPNRYMNDGSPQVYWGGTNNGGAFGSYTNDFFQMWAAQNGGCFNPLLGALGSLLIFGGGHGSWSGSNVLRFDVASGMWSNYAYPIYANCEKSITGGTIAALTGHTVKPATAPRDADNLNVRVSNVGNYIKLMDDTVIAGSGAAVSPAPYGSDVTVWNPMPMHTNCGIAYLPPEAGGGPLGSMIIQGHDQSNVSVPNNHAQQFRFDCATKVWSAVFVGDLIEPGLSVNVAPGLEYDSTRKIMWIILSRNTQLTYIDYKTNPPTKTKQSGSFISQSGVSMCNATFVPTRNMMVFIDSGGDIAESSPGRSDQERERYPYIWVWRLGTSTTTPVAMNETVVTTSPPSGATYVAAMRAGTNTGWPGYRSSVSGREGQSELGPQDAGSYTAPNGVQVTDASGIMTGAWGVIGTSTRGSADRLEYCPLEDCLLYLDIGPTTLPYMKLWKLRLPPIGQELTGTYTWEKEYIDAPPASTAPLTTQTKLLPMWGGRARYIEALKCFIYSNNGNGNEASAGVVRSAAWT